MKFAIVSAAVAVLAATAASAAPAGGSYGLRARAFATEDLDARYYVDDEYDARELMDDEFYGRDVYDEDALSLRELMDALEYLDARADKVARLAVKTAGNVFDAVGQNKMKDQLNSVLPKPKVDPKLAGGLADAAKRQQDALKKKKRELMDSFEYLDARADKVARLAVKTAGNVFDAVGQNKMKDLLPKPKVDPKLAGGLADAAKRQQDALKKTRKRR